MYPTREQVLDMMNCFNNECRECKAYKPLCYTTRDDRASSWLAVLDAIDAKQAELDGRTKALDWTANRCDELALEAGLKNIELNKAHDLIRRMSGTLMEWDKWDNSGLIGEAKEMLEVS